MIIQLRSFMVVIMNDNVKLYDYINVKEKEKKLNCEVSAPFIILPTNFKDVKSKDDFRYTMEDKFIQKMFVLENQKAELLIDSESSEEFSGLDVLPITLFVTCYILLPLALNVIGNRLSDLLKNRKAKISFIVNNEGSNKCLQVVGTADDIIACKDELISLSRPNTPLDEIQKAKELLDTDIISEEEFIIIKEAYIKKIS